MRRSTSSSPVEAASAVEDAVLSAVEEAVLSAAEEEAVLPPQAARLTHIAAAIVAAIIFFFIWCSP